jgi:hypothetical protein
MRQQNMPQITAHNQNSIATSTVISVRNANNARTMEVDESNTDNSGEAADTYDAFRKQSNHVSNSSNNVATLPSSVGTVAVSIQGFPTLEAPPEVCVDQDVDSCSGGQEDVDSCAGGQEDQEEDANGALDSRMAQPHQSAIPQNVAATLHHTSPHSVAHDADPAMALVGVGNPLQDLVPNPQDRPAEAHVTIVDCPDGSVDVVFTDGTLPVDGLPKIVWQRFAWFNTATHRIIFYPYENPRENMGPLYKPARALAEQALTCEGMLPAIALAEIAIAQSPGVLKGIEPVPGDSRGQMYATFDCDTVRLRVRCASAAAAVLGKRIVEAFIRQNNRKRLVGTMSGRTGNIFSCSLPKHFFLGGYHLYGNFVTKEIASQAYYIARDFNALDHPMPIDNDTWDKWISDTAKHVHGNMCMSFPKRRRRR